MSLTLILLIIFSVLEAVLWLPSLWRLRRVTVCGLIPIIALLSGLLFGQRLSVWAGIIAFLSIYRLINLLRILENRLQPKQLYVVTRRTSYWLIGLQVMTGVCALTAHALLIDTSKWLFALSTLGLITSLMLAASTIRHLRTTKTPTDVPPVTDKDLPTLSVLVPARNETEDLEACLQSLITSNYSKLEILVLDDCSQNKRTPEIIKAYAHAGVRFIAGKTPPKHWLAKNYAYQQLAEAANGELLLFCGVDTRFQPNSLRTMVEIQRAKHKSMISFIPVNTLLRNPEALLIQPARYAWELALPRRLFRRPPVLSTCWVIQADELQHGGGFEATANSISVESFFARHAISHDDGYSFLQSNETIGLVSAKSVPEQRATAVRTRYPQLHRRPELVAAQSILELTLLIAPFGLFVDGLIQASYGLAALNAVSALILVIIYMRISALAYRRTVWLSILLLPFSIIYDICLLNYSLWRYEFREVIWKGRNVCIPLQGFTPPLQDLQNQGKKSTLTS